MLPLHCDSALAKTAACAWAFESYAQLSVQNSHHPYLCPRQAVHQPHVQEISDCHIVESRQFNACNVKDTVNLP